MSTRSLALGSYGVFEPVQRYLRALDIGRVHPFMWGVVLLAALTFGAGIQAPPANADSMTYHLPRTTYWAQHGNVNFYYTHFEPQIYHPPLAEFAILWIRLLTGSDRLTFVVQWAAYLGCIGLVYRIARKLNSSGIVAAVFAATIPMAMMQASSTQNDLLGAFWLACMVWFILEEKPLYVGVAVGLAIMTKGTSYVYALPFLVWFAFQQLRSRQLGRLFAAGVIALAINGPHYLRNLQWYGSPIGSGEQTYNNEEISLRVLISSMARNLSLHLPFPGREITTDLGLELTDPGITWYGIDFKPDPFNVTEDAAGAPIHVFIIFLMLTPALLKSKTGGLALCLVIGWVLFCGLVKWQVWHTRLHLPLLILWSPVIAAVLPRRAGKIVAAGLLVAGIGIMLLNPNRPIESWFREVPAPPRFVTFAARVQAVGCDRVQFVDSGDLPEYYLHRLLPGVTFTHDPNDATACAVWSEKW